MLTFLEWVLFIAAGVCFSFSSWNFVYEFPDDGISCAISGCVLLACFLIAIPARPLIQRLRLIFDREPEVWHVHELRSARIVWYSRRPPAANENRPEPTQTQKQRAPAS